MIPKLLAVVKQYRESIYLGVCIILVTIIGYNIGRINTLRREPSQSIEANIFKTAPSSSNIKTKPIIIEPIHIDMRVVASKKSKSKLYHYTWCSGAQRIKEEDKLWFDTASAAQAAGYKLAGNCQE